MHQQPSGGANARVYASLMSGALGATAPKAARKYQTRGTLLVTPQQLMWSPLVRVVVQPVSIQVSDVRIIRLTRIGFKLGLMTVSTADDRFMFQVWPKRRATGALRRAGFTIATRASWPGIEAATLPGVQLIWSPEKGPTVAP
jgi:hypothetical protein